MTRPPCITGMPASLGAASRPSLVPHQSAAQFTRSQPAPALEGVPEAGGFAVAKLLGDQVDRQVGIEQKLARLVVAHLIKQMLEAGIELLQVAAQSALGTVQAAGDALQRGARSQIADQLLANELTQIVARVQLGLQLHALLQAVLMADRIGQRQRPLQQRGVEAQGIAAGSELHRTAEFLAIARGMAR